MTITEVQSQGDSLFKFDKWQRDILAHEGNISIRTGRQCGKSETISEKGKRLALEYDNTNTLVVAASQRQSALLFEKIKAKIELEHRPLVDEAIRQAEEEKGRHLTKEERRFHEWN